jgi:hypothetical protein
MEDCMADVILGAVNDAGNGTTIYARGEVYSDDFVLKAAVSMANEARRIDGVHGTGINSGAGVVGNGGQAAPRGKVHAAGAGVVGTGGSVREQSAESPGAGVIGLGTGALPPDPQASAGVGVFGLGATITSPGSGAGGVGVAGMGSWGTGKTGAGVVGVSTTIQFPDPERTAGVGVYGESQDRAGVLGVGGGPVVVETRGTPGVIGLSGSGPGGEFSSDTTGQLCLVPSVESKLPTVGRRGDLWVHNTRPALGRAGRKTRVQQSPVSLFLCVQDFPVVRWQRVLLDSVRIKGGTVVS